MMKLVIANIRGYAVRFSMTALAVTLGVALVAGTFILTDGLRATYKELASNSYKGIDLVVAGRESAAGSGEAVVSTGLGQQVPLDLTSTVANVDGIDKAFPRFEGQSVLVGRDGKAVRNGSALTVGRGFNTLDPSLESLNGSAPNGDDQIAVEKQTLIDSGLGLGEKANVLVNGEQKSYTIVGSIDVGNTAGQTLVWYSPEAAEKLFAPEKTVSQILVVVNKSTNLDDLKVRLSEVLPGEAIVRTPAEQASLTAKNQPTQALSFMSTFMMLFSVVALIAGAFIIVNTFAMLLAQRQKELAMMRAIGSERGQLTVMVLAEAAIIGIVGAIAGLLLGIALAYGLQDALEALGISQAGVLPVRPRTVLLALAIGLGVTVISAAIPTFRATRIAPVAAMREDPTGSHMRIDARLFVTTLMLFGGLVGSVLTLNAPGFWQSVGLALAAVSLFAAFIVGAALIVRPVLGGATKIFGHRTTNVRTIARANTLRNPRRTAITAGALMVGLAVVCMMAVLTSSAVKSTSAITKNLFTADLVVSAGIDPIDPGIGERISQLSDVDNVAVIRGAVVAFGGERQLAAGTTARDLVKVIDFKMYSGKAGSLDNGKILVAEPVARQNGWVTGDRVSVAVGTLAERELEIGGVYRKNAALGEGLLLPLALVNEGMPSQYKKDNLVAVKLRPGSDFAATRQQIEEIVAPYLVVSVQSTEAYADSTLQQVKRLLGIIYVLLVLSVAIATLGIINTLAMSVRERYREIGMLRAVGLDKAQLWSMITIESILTAIFGAILGSGLGLALGVLIQQSLINRGLTTLAIPWSSVGIVMASSVVIGVVAAVIPAYRATKLNVVAAISHQ